MCAMRENGNAGLMCMSDSDRTLEIAVNVSPWRSLVPMSTVALSNVIPCDLCIVKAHAIRSGICRRVPLLIGEMGTCVGCAMSHVVPLYCLKSTTTKDGNSRGFELGA